MQSLVERRTLCGITTCASTVGMGGSTGVDRTIPDGNPIDSTLDAHGETPGEHVVGAEGAIEEAAS